MAALQGRQHFRLAADFGHRGGRRCCLRLLLMPTLDPGHFRQWSAVGGGTPCQIAMRVDMGGKGINGGKAVDQLAQGDSDAETFAKLARGLRQQQAIKAEFKETGRTGHIGGFNARQIRQHVAQRIGGGDLWGRGGDLVIRRGGL